MDPCRHLRDDHRRLRRLLDELLGTRAARRRGLLLERLDRLLGVHAAVEEEVLYPALDSANGGESRTGPGCEAHLAVQRDLAALAALPDADPRFAAGAAALRTGLAGHLADEEATLFPLARRRLASLAQAALARRLRRRRDEAVALAARSAVPALVMASVEWHGGLGRRR